MFLINASTLQLEHFIGAIIPPYSILSHRWGDEEVDYQTFKTQHHGVALKGYAKIASACSQSLRQGIKYTWVDTCCIDKTSSAELTEAINSMYEWYQKAEVCFAFLQDIEKPVVMLDHSEGFIRTSQWLERGWTLQELLAPSRVKFYDRDWAFIGTRGSLAVELSTATGIARQYMNDSLSSWSRRSLILRASVGERMSWAARRVTTRTEDEAYCLLGLFGVNMPLIYGEGSHAFLRLQEEILRHSFDPTLLSWGVLDGNHHPLVPSRLAEPSKLSAAANHIFGTGHPWSRTWREKHDVPSALNTVFLAPQPRNFLDCDELIVAEGWDLGWALTPGGLQINLPLSRWLAIEQQPYLVLPCFPRDDPSLLLAIPVLVMGNGPILRGANRAVYVPSHKWYQWPTAQIVLATRGDHVSVKTRLRRSQLRCDVWIRSVPKGFHVTDTPTGLNLQEGHVFLRADQAWDAAWYGDLSASLRFSLESELGCRWSLSVRRRPYRARPLRALFPSFCVLFRATSRRYHSEVSIAAPGSRPPPIEHSQWFGSVHRPGKDVVETVRGGLVSIEAMEEDIAGQSLLVIDIRHGPSRLGHIWQILRHDLLHGQYHGLRSDSISSSAAHRPVSQMVAAALRSLATDMYDGFRLYYWLAALVLMVCGYRSHDRTLGDMLFFTCLASFGLEIASLFSLRPSSIASVATRVCACGCMWQHFENSYHNDRYSGPSGVAWGQIRYWGPVIAVQVFFLYSLLPVVSILAPRATPFIWEHRFILAATVTSLLLHLASAFVSSPVPMWISIIFVAKSSLFAGRYV